MAKFQVVLIGLVLILIGVGVFVITDRCDRNEAIDETAWHPVGALVGIEVIPTSFSKSAKCVVTTTEGVFIVHGLLSGMIGSPVRISDDNYLYIEGGRRPHAVY